MSTFVGLANRIYVAHLDLSGAAHEVSIGNLKRRMVPFTTFNDGGFETTKPGLAQGDANVKLYQDYDAGVLDDQISFGQLGTQYPISVVPSQTGTITAGDPCIIARGVLSDTNPLAGAKGDAGQAELGLTFDTVTSRGFVAHPLAARTTTGNGTAVAQAGPSATQSLYAALHVTAYSGLTNVVFKVQSDDNSGFSSATDRITFTTVTGTTSEWKSVAGDFSSETHLRPTWTVTGTGSVSFVVACAVL